MSFVSREEWGARETRGAVLLQHDDVKGVALHWPAMSTKVRGIPNVSHLLRNIQNYHMDTHGWSDIAYQIAVDQDGNRYQLRGIKVRSAANGDRDVNETYGAFLLVLAIGEQPTLEMIKTVNRRLKNFDEYYVKAGLVKGHNEVRPEPTACPGPIVSSLIHRGIFHA